MRRWKTACAALISVGIVLAGCGSDDDDAGTTAPPPSADATAPPVDTDASAPTPSTGDTDAPASTEGTVDTTVDTRVTVDTAAPSGPATGEPIKLALVGEFNAGGTDLTGFMVGMEAWAEQLNEGGGIDGRPVELNRCDAKLDPTAATACAQDAAADPDVLGFVGGISGLYPVAIAPVATEAGMLAFPGYSVSQPEGQMPTGFVAWAGVRSFLQGLPKYLVEEQGLSKVAIIRADLDATAPNADLVREAVEAAGGEFVADVRAPLTASDLLPAVTEAAAAGAQVIVPSLTNAGAIGVVNAIRDGGFVDQIAIATSPTYLGDEAFEQAVQDAGVTWYLATETDIYFNADNPAHDGYLAALELTGDSDLAANGQVWTSYAAGLALQQILEAAGPDLTRESILAAAMDGTFEVDAYPSPLHRNVDPENPAFAVNEIFIVKYPDEILTAEPVTVID